MAGRKDVQWDYWIGADYWHYRKAWEPWELCALSLYIEPTSMNANRTEYSIGPWTAAHIWGEESSRQIANVLGEFNRRLSLLTEDRNDHARFTPEDNGKLLVHEFVTWMKEKEIQHFPLELARLDAKPKELTDWADTAAALSSSETHTYRQFANPSDHPGATLFAPACTASANERAAMKTSADSHPESVHEIAIDPTHNPSAGRRWSLHSDVLDAVIDKAISSAGSHDPAAVYLELKALALAEASPFKGTVEKGGALIYTAFNNEDRSISKDALRKRLRRRVSAANDR
jgi:hypothetical protein